MTNDINGNIKKRQEKGIFWTHNQGVPGSCPGGPTQKRFQGLVFETFFYVKSY